MTILDQSLAKARTLNFFPSRASRTIVDQPSARKQSPFLWPAFREGRALWQITDFNSYIHEGFEMNTLIYEAIMYKVRSTWYTPLRAYVGDPVHPEVLALDHPLAALAARPNSYQSCSEFMGLNTVYLNVSGNSFVLLDRPKKNGLPTAMYPLRPDRVFIVPAQRNLKGYLYVPEGKAINDGVPILPEDMIHIRLPNPADPLEGMGYGLSPFAAMARSADVDNAVTEFLKLFFQRGTAMNTYLKFDVSLDDDTAARVKERFMDMYGGFKKWSEVGVMDQGGEIKTFGMNFKEMGFETIDARNEARITGPFGVPLTVLNTLVGMGGATYSNKETDRRIFWEDTMLPELGLHEVDYQYYLRGDDGAYVAFDTRQIPALKKDKVAAATAFAALVNVGTTKHTAAAFLDMDLGKIPDGDVIYLPLNLIPMGAVKPVSTPVNEAQVINESEVPDATNQDENVNKSSTKLLLPELIFEAKELAEMALAVPEPLPAPSIDIHVHLPDQAAPVVNITNQVQPTPVQVQVQNDVKVEPTPIQVLNQNDVQVNPTPITNQITVEPTPVQVQNQNDIHVSPTPVTNQIDVLPAPVTNQISVEPTPVTIENQNQIEVKPAPVTIEPAKPGTEVTDIERDAQGNITRTIKKTT
jgi:HK97 family phage portal protein